MTKCSRRKCSKELQNSKYKTCISCRRYEATRKHNYRVKKSYEKEFGVDCGIVGCNETITKTENFKTCLKCREAASTRQKCVREKRKRDNICQKCGRFHCIADITLCAYCCSVKRLRKDGNFIY